MTSGNSTYLLPGKTIHCVHQQSLCIVCQAEDLESCTGARVELRVTHPDFPEVCHNIQRPETTEASIQTEPETAPTVPTSTPSEPPPPPCHLRHCRP